MEASVKKVFGQNKLNKIFPNIKLGNKHDEQKLKIIFVFKL